MYGVYVYTVDVSDRKQQIVRAAFDIADERGLGAVTMRAVAARVGITAMALYRHVADKEELLDGVLEILLSGLVLPDAAASSPWDVRLAAMARATRDLARRHPSTIGLVFLRPGQTPHVRRIVAAIHAALADAGVPERDHDRLERMFSTFVAGFALSEVSGRFPSRSGYAEIDSEFDQDLADLCDVVRGCAARGA